MMQKMQHFATRRRVEWSVEGGVALTYALTARQVQHVA